MEEQDGIGTAVLNSGNRAATIAPIRFTRGELVAVLFAAEAGKHLRVGRVAGAAQHTARDNTVAHARIGRTNVGGDDFVIRRLRWGAELLVGIVINGTAAG